MCHHYRGSRNPPAHLANEFSARTNLSQLGFDLKQIFADRVNYYPTNPVPVVRLDNAGERELVEMEWGFLPAWWKPKNEKDKPKAYQRMCFNARSEDIETKSTYRNAFKSRRCLLPGVEFMEKGHYFSLSGKATFAFAGIWEEWVDRSAMFETSVVSCSMLTTEPNAEVRSVGHHRMPVLLTSEAEYAAWLNPEIVERGPLEGLMRPLADGVLEASPA
jgi:putative SOS response-associated peptidase YedK